MDEMMRVGDVAAIGAEPLIRGYALAGVRLYPAATDDDARTAWRSLPPGVDLVILTAAAGQALGDAARSGQPLVAVLP
jgi:vacuolar-type H+-ATPase subunit F/Vma7